MGMSIKDKMTDIANIFGYGIMRDCSHLIRHLKGADVTVDEFMEFTDKVRDSFVERFIKPHQKKRPISATSN